jgi:4-amino-4-deoxy-L-arabinose transferase-like glycosyltransferase
MPSLRTTVWISSLAHLQPENGSLGRALNFWLDNMPIGLSVRLLLLSFIVVWTSFQFIAFSSVGLHPDMLETYSWGLHPSAGYYKHPPLSGLIAGAWFSLFPPSDWAFHLLAMTNGAAGLYAADLIARRHLKGDKRLVALMFLLLTPFYQFHAERFGSNQVLLSTWPIATYCFLRAFETRGLVWSACAGAAAALAMLGKYYSIFLIAGFVVAALTHPARLAYLRSPSPRLSAAVGLVMLAPHVHWLITNAWMPFTYAVAVHGGAPLYQVLWKDAVYVLEACLYVALPVSAYAMAVRPSSALLRETLWPHDHDARLLAVVLYTPLILPAVVAPFIGAQLTALWTMPGWFLLPVLLLRPPEASITRVTAIRIVMLVVVTTIGSLGAAPWVAWRYGHYGTKEYREFYRLAAAEAADAWHRTTSSPLRIVGGDLYLVAAMTFYDPHHPDSVPTFALAAAPWVTEQRLGSEGFAAICLASDENCIAEAKRRGIGRNNTSFADFSTNNGYRNQRFFLLIVPPRPEAGLGIIESRRAATLSVCMSDAPYSVPGCGWKAQLASPDGRRVSVT